jgi:hypothetical protein
MKTKVAQKETGAGKVARVIPRRGAAFTMAVGAATTAAFVLKRSRASQIQKTVQYLRSQLGDRVTAYLSGADDVLVVDRWIQGETRPDKLHWKRLKSAYEAAQCLVKAYDDQTARSWFLGMNPSFDDQSPARVLRSSKAPRTWGDVVLAAREFAET